MINKLNYNILILLLAIAVNLTYGQSTDLPCDASRVCTNLEQCPVLYDQTKGEKSINAPIYKELKRLHCGYSENSPKVCCPSITTDNRIDELSDITKHSNYHLLRPKSCGTPSEEDRISKGNKTELLEYPWMVLLIYKSSNVVSLECGGTMINYRYALTAAHCVSSLGTKTLEAVRVGEHNINTPEDCTGPLRQRSCAPPISNIPVEQVIVHPEYRTSTLRHDIALIRLRTPVDPNRALFEPICLPTTTALINKDLDNESGVITGWGLTENKTVSGTLLQAMIPVINNQDCGVIHNKSIQSGVGYRQMCAGGDDGVVSCNGDSGGPLHIKTVYDGSNDSRTEKFVQYGIISFGHRQCGANYPTVFTRVANYMNWILNQIKE